MTLQAAIASGKAFSRPTLVGEIGYFKSEDIGDGVVLSGADVIATDYVLQEAREVTHADLVAAWNGVRTGFTSVKSAEESRLFQAFAARLLGT